MKISSYNQLIALFTLMSGLIVFALLWDKYQQVEQTSRLHYQAKLAKNNINHFSTMSQTWLTTQDLFFSGKQSYLASGIISQSHQLVTTLEQMKAHETDAITHTPIQRMVELVELNTMIIKTLVTSVEKKNEVWQQKINQSDVFTAEFVQLLFQVNNDVINQEQLLANNVEESNKAMQFWSWVLGLSYIICIGFATRWISQNIIKPIEKITAITNKSRTTKCINFAQYKAPIEIIALGKAISGFSQRIEIEKQKAQQEEMNASEANNRTTILMNSVPTAIVLLNHLGEIKEFNHEAIRIFQSTSADILNSKIGLFLPILATTKGEFDTEFSLKTAEEALLSPNITAPYVEYSGRKLMIHSEEHYLIAISDINERKNNQKALSALNEQLINAEKMASIGQLAAGIAHEINNPIGYVQSNVDILEEYSTAFINYINFSQQSVDINKLSDCYQENDLEFIMSDIPKLLDSSKEGIIRVTQIIKDLGNYSHADNKTPELVQIDKLIEQSLSLVINELKYKATIETDLHATANILGYPQKLLQVFINLLVNASHAIDKQGTIKISTENSHDQVSICIEDNGLGINVADLSKIFDPFFTTKPVDVGTGLGLHIVKAIVEEHKGHITVKSVIDKGSQFIIYLPIADTETNDLPNQSN